MNMDTRLDPISVVDVESLLLTQESRIEKKSQSLGQSETPMANVAQYNLNSNWNRGRGYGSGRGQYYNGAQFNRGGHYSQRGQNYHRGGYNNAQSFTTARSFAPRGRGSFGRGRIQCQLCGKTGHLVTSCFYRFDQNFSGPSQLQDSHDAQGHLAEFGEEVFIEPQYNLGSDDSYELPQSDFSPAAMLATPSTSYDYNWYPDSGATNHITSAEDNLTMKQEFTGSEKVLLGNGMGLQISHIGCSFFSTPDHRKSLILDQLLHVPQITKNLLSVSKFCADNNAFF